MENKNGPQNTNILHLSPVSASLCLSSWLLSIESKTAAPNMGEEGQVAGLSQTREGEYWQIPT